jgi:hypothetical protein
MIRSKISLFFTLVFLICLTFSSKLFSQSIAFKLAAIEKNGYVAENDALVKRFDLLLSQLSYKYVDSKQEIADKTVTAKQILQSKGINESMTNIMEGMNSIIDPKNSRKYYDDYLFIYIIKRQKSSHAVSIKYINDSLRIIGIDGLKKSYGI